MLSEQSFPYPAPRCGASPTRLLIGASIPSSSSGRPYQFLVVVASPAPVPHCGTSPCFIPSQRLSPPHLPLPLADTLWDRPSSLLFTAGSSSQDGVWCMWGASLISVGRLEGDKGGCIWRERSLFRWHHLAAHLCQRSGWERLPRNRGRECV